MQNFDYHTPTRLIFGKDVIKELQKTVRKAHCFRCEMDRIK
jgi:alcohol dehydrogenase YqhD (iron-dependent ADH family)